MSLKRRDNKNRILRNGESQRSDGRSYGTIQGIRGVVKPAFQGFAEGEVFAALEAYGFADRKKEVKKWYDGFTFGGKTDI